MEKETNLIVGAGLSGAVAANILAENGEKVLVIDRKDHIAGNVYDYKDENNIHIHKYGPHIFHTRIKEVWDYLSKFTQWNYFFLKPNVIIEGKPVSLPFSLATIYELFSPAMAERLENKLVEKYGYNVKVSILELKNNDDKDLKFLAEYVYENVFKNYTMKQWDAKPEDIDFSITARVPVQINHDTRYFDDKYQGIPLRGYTAMVKKMFDHRNIEVKLKTEASEYLKKDWKRVFYTGAIDEYFNYKYGELPYRSLRFDMQTRDVEYYQRTVVTNYPNNYDFTRITEHKYFLNEKSDKTVISIEYPQKFVNGQNERYYPIVGTENEALYKKYLADAEKLDNVYFFGRLGDYKYYNMDLAVDRALKLIKNILK